MVWDFSKKLSSNESSQVFFEKDSTGIVTVSDPGKISYYRIIDGKIIQVGSESPTDNRKYVVEKLMQKFPKVYGDSLSMPFTCEGMYCGDHPFRETGTSSVKVDAVGAIVLAENDTVRDVKRVHTIDSYSICMDINSAALDTAQLRQVIEERYEWYLPESQYPIFESVTSTSYFNMDPLGTTKYAFCNLPEDKVAYYITQDGEMANGEEDNSFDQEQTEPDILHYNVETNGGVIRITYDLDADATINTIVASPMGITYRHKAWNQQSGHGYSTQIDCNGLRKGTYILYINVNGKVYSNKVTL